jgi:SOS-response transcriptional repressor LexA
MDIGERLKKARQFLGLDQVEIAEVLDVKSSFLSNIERGAKKPPQKLIELFSSRYKINANWILTGEGDMVIEKTETIETTPLVKEMKNLISEVTSPKFTEIESRLAALETLLKQGNPAPGGEGPLHTSDPAPEYGGEEEEYEEIPYVWDIAAGPPIAQSDDRGETVAVPARLLRKGWRYYAATIRGGSMAEAGIRDGDMVLVRCTDAPRDGAIQVVRYKDKSTLKLLKEAEGGAWELHYRDGSGRVISCDSGEYETQGEFEAVLPESTAIRSR